MRIKQIFESNLESENLTQIHKIVEFDAQERVCSPVIKEKLLKNNIKKNNGLLKCSIDY